MSCRPSDWRVSIDLATMQDRLPFQYELDEVPPTDAERLFLAALSERDRNKKEQDGKAVGNNGVRVVSLLPLGTKQIELFARELGVDNAPEFIAELDKQHAWWLARRPLDLSELVAIWLDSKRLGTRSQQHEANVRSKLRDTPDRPDKAVLSEVKARNGAEQVALALALTKRLTIAAPEQAMSVTRSDRALDVADVLPDWSEEERQALLRRALFDPATYGRVRFHNRSVQEYLAARRLASLREKRMPAKAMLQLLFAERYGTSIVIPSRACDCRMVVFVGCRCES